MWPGAPGTATMRRPKTVTLVAVTLLVGLAVAPTAVAGQPDGVDECTNAERGPGEDGPPGFVADLVPNAISDLIAGLPVPDFVKGFFGAPTC